MHFHSKQRSNPPSSGKRKRTLADESSDSEESEEEQEEGYKDNIQEDQDYGESRKSDLYWLLLVQGLRYVFHLYNGQTGLRNNTILKFLCIYHN